MVIEERSLPVVRFIVATRQGAALDPVGQSGITSATFELMLRGTQKTRSPEF
ncbi:MAG: hypothetical protein R3C68_15275 [Myxococcota bacterium]